MNFLHPSPETLLPRRRPGRVIVAAGLLALSLTVSSCRSDATCELPRDQIPYTTGEAYVRSPSGTNYNDEMAELARLVLNRYRRAPGDQKKTTQLLALPGVIVDVPLRQGDISRGRIRLETESKTKGRDGLPNPNTVQSVTLNVYGNVDTPDSHTQAVEFRKLIDHPPQWRAQYDSEPMFDAVSTPDRDRAKAVFGRLIELVKDGAAVTPSGNAPGNIAPGLFCLGDQNQAALTMGRVMVPLEQ